MTRDGSDSRSTPLPVLSPGARALSEHQRTTGMAVSMGWTCRCGVYVNTLAEQLEHQAEQVRLAIEGEKQ